MPSTVSLAPTQALETPFMHAPKVSCIKTLAESPDLTSIPSSHAFKEPLEQTTSNSEEPIPIIDFSLLSGTPQQRSTVIHDLRKACQDWGFFMVINHGIPEWLMKKMMDGVKEFFDLTEEEKQEFAGKNVLDPIRCGTSFNLSVDRTLFWRDFLKVFVHPDFHSPNKPHGFSEVSMEYCRRVREVARELLEGISESLGLEPWYIYRNVKFEEGFQVQISNLYPPCPQPEHAMGQPPHSDHGLLTLLAETQTGGLQVKRNGKWVDANSIPNSFLVNTGDHLEILSNGKYKSNVHRAVVNNKATRISIAVVNGPSLDAVVGPAPELMERECQPPAYAAITYRDYMQFQQSNSLDDKTCLDRVRIN